MTTGSPTVAELATRYIATLAPEERAAQQLELNKFVRWFGPSQPIDTIDARLLESYQEQVVNSGANLNRRLEPLRALLTYAQREGYVEGNLAKYLKLKRIAGRRDGKEKANNEVILENEATQLTAEGYAKMKDELERLVNVERAKVAQELWEARQDKDIRENAPYDAAKQHQALVEARIRELEHALSSVEIIQSGANGGRVGVGSRVVLRDLIHDEELSYTLVGPQEANPRAGKISVASPVGKALIDRGEGEVVEVDAPAGVMRYRIEKVGR